MTEVPETRYVAVGDADVAYRVLGDRPPDILIFNPLGSHLELTWDLPVFGDFYARIASIGRLIIFDRRGFGMSDAIPRDAIPTWEDFAEDAAAVVNTVGSEQATILAFGDSGPLALLFAATHPQRVTALFLVSSYARYAVAENYPIGVSSEVIDAIVEATQSGWGTRDFARLGMADISDEQLDKASAILRASATPRSAAAQIDYLLRSLDVRDALPMIQVPTFVLYPRDHPWFPLELGHYLVEHIGGSKFVEFPGSSAYLGGENAEFIADEITEFLTGERPAIEVDRILTTLMFTDIVGSTEKAASLGDQRWRSLLDAHDLAVREQLRRFRGKEINTTGDGFVVSFDGPARGLRCAKAIIEATGKLGVQLRIGFHGESARSGVTTSVG